MSEALQEARAYTAVNEVMVFKGGRGMNVSKQDLPVFKAKGWKLKEEIEEANMKRILQALQDKLSKEGGAAGFDDLKKTAKSMGLDLTPQMLKNMPGIKQHRDGDYILEETITEFKKMVVTIADPMKRKKAMDDLESLGREQNVDTGFKIQRLGSRSFKVDGMGADLNKYATDMKNFYGATVKAEDLDAQPQDKDVKKVKGTQPKKYYKKLDKDTKKKRAAFFKKKAGTYKKSDDDDDYKPAPGDEKAKTKPSTFTKKFKQMYGDNYGYTAMHAKGVAKLNPLRRKDESK